MNKGELVEKVAKECALGKTAAEQVVASVFGAIMGTMKSGDQITQLFYLTAWKNLIDVSRHLNIASQTAYAVLGRTSNFSD